MRLAPRLAWLLIGGLVLPGCGGPSTDPSGLVPPSAPSRSPAESTEPINRSAPPDIGLTPLPTAQQVQQAAPGGRRDPFQPLPVTQKAKAAATQSEGTGATTVDQQRQQDGSDPASDPGSGLELTGVLLVGGESRALVRNASTSGVLCVSSDGRCEGDRQSLLPAGWSVLAIDVQRGCIRLAQDGQAQTPVCMA
jgi:hypothetical protein